MTSIDDCTPITIRQKLQKGLENAFGVSPTIQQNDSEKKMTQKEAFFAQKPFTLFPLGSMPSFKYNPGIPSWQIGPTLDKINHFSGKSKCFCTITNVTDSHFQIITYFMGLYEMKKFMAFEGLCFIEGKKEGYYSTSPDQSVAQPSELTLTAIEEECGWMKINQQPG